MVAALAVASLLLGGCDELDLRPGSPGEAREYTSRFSIRLNAEWEQNGAPFPSGPFPRTLQQLIGPPTSLEPDELSARMWVLSHRPAFVDPRAGCREALRWLGQEGNRLPFRDSRLQPSPSRMDTGAVDEIAGTIESRIAQGSVEHCASGGRVTPRGSDEPAGAGPTELLVDSFSFLRRGRTYSILLVDDASDRRASVVPVLRSWRWGPCC